MSARTSLIELASAVEDLQMRRSTVLAIVAVALVEVSRSASAGNCLSRADGFELSSDTVHWRFAIHSSSECLQGLRGGSMLIDEVKIIDPPSAGSVTISGPAFFYRAPATSSTDHFKLQISGENNRMRGMSTIVVEVLVR
jgi:hypothetical protein